MTHPEIMNSEFRKTIGDLQTRYISNEEHYSEVLRRMERVKRELWIGTADLKDVYMQNGTPLLGLLAKLLKRGVNVRLIHAKEPGENFREDFDRYPILIKSLERMLCPRVHFKLIIFDLTTAYIGSANFTGAGLGAKGAKRRNFEAGVFTSDPALVQAAVEQFDTLWMGAPCQNCARKTYCADGAD